MNKFLFWLTCIVIATGLLFGGGTRQGLISDSIPQIFALLLIAFAAPAAMPILRNERWTVVLLLGILILPLSQIIPLPSFIWKILPGRQAILDIYTVAGVEIAWRPLSLIPSASWRAFIFLLPAAAVFLCVLSLDRQARQWLLFLILAVSIVSVPVAMLQVVGGPDSPLYFFDITNAGRGVGFFANANHFAAFQYAMLPLAACALIGAREQLGGQPLLIFGAVGAISLTGLSLSGSRSALLLGVLSAGLTAVFILRSEISKIGRRRGMLVAVGLLLLLIPLASGMGLLAILERFGKQDVAEDARWVLAGNTWRAIWNYFPFGSGFGTFPDIYQFHERIQDVFPAFVNRAHDDLLEILLEGGVFSLCLLIGLIAWLVVHTIKAFRRELSPGTLQARAGIIVLWLFLIHSLWDYPMRTTALTTVAAVCMAFQFRSQFERGIQSASSRPRRKRSASR